MGIKGDLFQGIGSLVHGEAAATAHITAHMKRYGINSTNMATKLPGAIAKRQAQVGRRVATGAAILGSVGFYKNRGGSRGGFRGPRGSGRYA